MSRGQGPKPRRRVLQTALYEGAELDQKPLDWAVLQRMVALTRPYARLRNTLLGLVVIRAVQLPLLSWGLAKVLSGPIAAGDIGRALTWTAELCVWIVLTELVFMYRLRLALRLGESVVYDMRRELYAQILRMPMSFFNHMPLGRLLSRTTSDVDVVRQAIQDVFFISAVQSGSMLLAAALMAYYDWFLFLVVAAAVPILWWMLQHFRSRVRDAYRRVQETYSRVTATLAESVTGIRVIQGFVREQRNEEKFVELVTTHAGNHLYAAKQSACFIPLIEMQSQLFLALLLVVGGYRALGGQIELEALVQFFFLSELFFGPIVILGRQYNVALTAMAGAERVFALLDAEPEWQDAPEAAPLGALRGHVEFRSVSFEYQPGARALDDVSFVVQPGQTVALVGETGSGKTTIVRLLSKLYLPTAGAVLLDERDTRSLTSASLHRHLGTVPQDNLLFSGSVAENIRFAKPDASDEQLQAVVESLGLSELFADLPRGFDSEVGERGANLSLGQRQLVCFARAMIADPSLLILDEATSSLDPKSEARLTAALGRLLQGRTSFVVAHRLSTIVAADLILVLDEGRIVERGTHQQLLAARGRYAQLYGEFSRARGAS